MITALAAYFLFVLPATLPDAPRTAAVTPHRRGWKDSFRKMRPDRR